ncbi:MAG: serine/threonine-protein kinase [Betaproteobacteria bacterium]|jgi:serine/threonine protein kinase|nr:serine/threonine-protein kinase [Betaproteobacteria bacterium]MDH5344112.1 serine/threonine-protein kinase [Betaproteobacteria bacterium]
MADGAVNKIGKYEIVRRLGEGATSTVYLARDDFNSREVAIKLVSQQALQDDNRGKLMHNLFLTEASLAGKLNHPHIVQIFDAVADEDNTYIVMEYVAGGTLQRFTRADNLLALGDVIEIIYKCARALDFASRIGVIHRDIKPANILVKDNTDIKITDFGSAALGLTTRTLVDGIGTPAYMSPEQHLNQPANLQTDIYALGVVMFQMLTGKLPFIADNIAGLSHQILNVDAPLPSELRQEVPTEIDLVVRRAMARDPAVRYMTWEQFAKDLVAIAQGAPLPRHGVLDTEKFNVLRTLSFFRGFGDVQLWEVLRFSEWVDVAKGEVIMKEGDPGDFFGILVSGEARVLRKRRLLSLLKAGECVGEMAYLGEAGNLRSADVVAATDVRMIKINVKALEHASEICLLKFDRAYLRILVERLAAANSKLSGI